MAFYFNEEKNVSRYIKMNWYSSL